MHAVLFNFTGELQAGSCGSEAVSMHAVLFTGKLLAGSCGSEAVFV